MPRKRKYIYGKIRRTIWEKFNRKCVKCGCETCLYRIHATYSSGKKIAAIDHILPFLRGGKCEESNFQLLCETCNSQKGAKLCIA